MNAALLPTSPILVTGANGFIGSNLCHALVRAGCTVRGFILEGTDPQPLLKMGVVCFSGDLRKPQTLKEPMRDVQTVFHLAALVNDWGKRSEFMAVNLIGTSNVLEAAVAAKAQRFVQMSSLAVHPFAGLVDADENTPATNHINGYCSSKIAAEHLVRQFHEQHKIATTIIRPGALIFGPGDTTTFTRLAPFLIKRRLPLLGGGRQLTCISYVENLVEGMILAAAKKEGSGETFILTDDLRVTHREIIKAMYTALEIPPKYTSIPVPLARFAAWLLEVIGKALRMRRAPIVHRYRVGIVARDFHFSCEKAKRLLGYQPRIPLQEGMRRMAAWYRSVAPEKF